MWVTLWPEETVEVSPHPWYVVHLLVLEVSWSLHPFIIYVVYFTLIYCTASRKEMISCKKTCEESCTWLPSRCCILCHVLAMYFMQWMTTSHIFCKLSFREHYVVSLSFVAENNGLVINSLGCYSGFFHNYFVNSKLPWSCQMETITHLLLRVGTLFGIER